MKYWVFTEAQLEAALAAYLDHYRRGHPPADADEIDIEVALGDAWIHGFLDSPEAREHKLLGGASYEPDSQR